MKAAQVLLLLALIHLAGIAVLLIGDHSVPAISGGSQTFPLPANPIFVQPIAPPGEQLTTYTPMYVSLQGEYEPLDIHCPIPMENRVPNFTGVQCVWSSIEMLGRWAEEPKLTNPPLTSRAECKSYSSPSLAAQVLTRLNVKFEQTYQNEQQGIALIKKAMAEGRGCLFGVPGHAMVLVHYDEATDTVKWVDNSDSTLKVQTMTVSRFRQRWDSWVLVIYADNDIVPEKIARVRNKMPDIPIIDRNNPQGQYPRDYIPLPQR